MKNKKMYIKSKFRLIMIILVISLLNMGTTIVSEENNIYDEIAYTDFIYITAKSGDTLWNIISRVYKDIEVERNLDFREVVDIVSSLNEGNQIFVGQTIRIPKIIKK